MKDNIWLSLRKNLKTQSKDFRLCFVGSTNSEYKTHSQFKFVEYTQIDLTETKFTSIINKFSAKPKCILQFKRYYLSPDNSFALDVLKISDDNYYALGRINGSNNSISSIQSSLVLNQDNFILPVRSKVMEYLYYTDNKFYEELPRSFIEGSYYSHQDINHFSSFPKLQFKDLPAIDSLPENTKFLASVGLPVYVQIPAQNPFPSETFALEDDCFTFTTGELLQ